MKVAIIILAVGLVACSPELEPEPWEVAPQNQRTATPMPVLGIMQHSLGLEVMPSPTPTATPTAPPAPTRMFTLVPVGSGVSAASVSGGSCMAAASVYDWPLTEVDYVIQHESGHNPMVVNSSSGACGCMQLLPCQGLGDPATNVAAGYAKWLDGGRSFQRHWYNWWR